MRPASKGEYLVRSNDGNRAIEPHEIATIQAEKGLIVFDRKTWNLNFSTPEQELSLCRCGEARGGEPDAFGGIFWADVSELYEPLPGYTQVVGHNRVNDVCDHANNGGRIIFCDCLFYEKYLKLE